MSCCGCFSITTTRSGIRETATTRNVMLWLFFNNHNRLWHVKIWHDAKVVLWLLKEMTTATNDLWEGVIRRPQVFSVWPVRSCYLWELQRRQWGFRTKSHLQPLCKEELSQHWAIRCKIWSGTTSSKKMVSLSNSSIPAFDTGTNVVVRVPDLGRGRLAPINVLAVVVDVISSGVYLLGTKEGLLERLYVRNEFTTDDNNFIEARDVPSSSLSLRSVSMITSGSKQGFVSCHCKKYCIDEKRKCLSENMKCHSRCHSNSSCKTK